jgi:hypothetical protein
MGQAPAPLAKVLVGEPVQPLFFVYIMDLPINGFMNMSWMLNGDLYRLPVRGFSNVLKLYMRFVDNSRGVQ